MRSSYGGAGDPPPAPPPLLRLQWVTVALCGYALAALVWLTFGDALPGGRWFAVHLFTLGILSNAVVALSEHFARTLLRTGGPDHRTGRFVLLNGGTLLVLGFPPSLRYPLVAGATTVAATVAWLAFDLHRMRAAARQARFAYVVRGYEHASIAFIVGATLGALLGTATLQDAWYGAGRLAHLHINVLGWGGLTLLSTLVFFGPTLMRTRMAANADATASRALPGAAAGLLVGAGGLVAAGADPGALWLRLIAATGLGVYAAAASTVCATVLASGRTAEPSMHGWMIRAACVWFVIIAWADALAVATNQLRLLDALGAVLIVAVLGQAIIAVLNYLTPMVWGAGPKARTTLRAGLEIFGRGRMVILNAAAVLILLAGGAGSAAGMAGAVVARTGWALVAGVVVFQLAIMVRASMRSSPA